MVEQRLYKWEEKGVKELERLLKLESIVRWVSLALLIPALGTQQSVNLLSSRPASSRTAKAIRRSPVSGGKKMYFSEQILMNSKLEVEITQLSHR